MTKTQCEICKTTEDVEMLRNGGTLCHACRVALAQEFAKLLAKGVEAAGKFAAQYSTTLAWQSIGRFTQRPGKA